MNFYISMHVDEDTKKIMLLICDPDLSVCEEETKTLFPNKEYKIFDMLHEDFKIDFMLWLSEFELTKVEIDDLFLSLIQVMKKAIQ
jgi:hypothetical protein